MTSMPRILSIGWLALVIAPIAVARETPPNIIFILADDLGWGDLGCYGQTKIQTPHLDRLAKEGIRFTDAYAGNSVCAPSRSCLMQGLHPGHARVRGNSYQGYRHSLQPGDRTVASLLQEAGYRTGLFGKWGLGLSDQAGTPGKMGFDVFFGYLNQRKAHSYYPEFLWDHTQRIRFPQHAGHDHKKQSRYDEAGKVIPDGIVDREQARYSFDVIHQQSVQFLRRESEGPFFLYLAHTIPHGPVIAPDLGPYKDRDWPIGHREWAAMVTRLDDAVGEILDLLRELGIDQRTVVFFASDNGHSSHGYDRDRSVATISDQFQSLGPTRGRKGDSYDGAFRVPAMVRWPGTVKANQVSDHVWAFWDFLPTAAELAGISVPHDTDGISLVPTLRSQPEQQKEHQYLYWEFGKNQAIRSGRWFAHRKGGGDVELYDLLKDPQQSNDLADRHPDTAAQVNRWMEESHSPSEVWPSPGESSAEFRKRLDRMGIGKRPINVDG